MGRATTERRTDAPAVLFVNREAMLGGMERMILLSMQQARAGGYRVLFACPGEGPLADEARAQGFEIIPFEFAWLQHTTNPVRLFGYLRLLRREGARLDRLCRERGIDLLHPHGPISALYASRAARRIPMLVHMHDAHHPKWSYRLATHRVARVAARFICVSRAVQRNVEAIGVGSVPTQVIYNAIDAAFLRERPEPAAEVTGDGPHIAQVAQIVALKGQHVFLEAARRVVEKLPSARFYLVGTLAHPDNRPYQERLEAMAAEPPLAGKVVFTGFRPDVPRWMAAMDVVVHAGVEPEAFGLVLAEAMALGKPVISTDLGGTPEVIEDSVTGRLVPAGDPDALADAIVETVSRPDPLMVERAEASVRARFTPERYGEDLCRLYAEVLGRKPRAVATGRLDG